MTHDPDATEVVESNDAEPETPADEFVGEGVTERTAQPGLGALAWISAGLVALIACRPLRDNSFLTHLATGRELLERGFPTSNPFLFTGGDFPIPSWWWSGTLAVAEQVGGGAAIRVLMVGLGALLGASFVALARPERRAPASDVPTFVSVAVPVTLAVFVMLPYITPRPHVAGFLLLAAVVIVWRDDRSPWWMVPLFATWVNVHGTWLYGLAILVLFSACASIEQRSWRRWFPVATAFLGVAVGGIWYPERFRLVGLPFEQFGDDRAREAIASYKEWQPAGFGHPLTWIVLGLGAAALLAMVRQRRWPSAVAVVMLVGLGLSAGRLLPIATISLLPWAGQTFRTLGGPGLTARRPASVGRVAGVAMVVIAGVLAVRGPAYDLNRYPVDAVDWLEARGLVASDGVRVVAPDDVGNYLDWRYGTRANAFVDDRPSVDALLDYRSLSKLRDDWPQVLDRVDPDVVVWPTVKPLTAQLDERAGWIRAATIGDVAVFCRDRIAARCT